MVFREEFWAECDGCGERYYNPATWLSTVEYLGEVLHVCKRSKQCLEVAQEEMDRTLAQLEEQNATAKDNQA